MMIKDGTPTFRFAPSPNGYLHLGHAFSALVGYGMAKRLGGRFLLRIEDIDSGRSRGTFVDAIFEDLKWLGVVWEEPVLFQSDRFKSYERAVTELREKGLLYRCFATRAEILGHAIGGNTDPDGAPLYPGLHKGLTTEQVGARLARGERAAWRIDMEHALRQCGEGLSFTEIDEAGGLEQRWADPARWGDAVIVRKDVPASYHLAVVIDDAAQGVTHVIRGRDLLAATDLHRLLQALLGLPEPLYHHHRLINDTDGRKLSKSDGDVSLRALRARGVSTREVRQMVGLEVW